MGAPLKAPIDQIVSKFEFVDDCWEWTGAITKQGYGIITKRRLNYLAHRVVYETVVGPIPDGLQLHHVCQNRRCVNPDHLMPLTPLEHSRIEPRLRSVCLSGGHVLDEENTYVYPDGVRICRECKNDRQRRYRAKKREA